MKYASIVAALAAVVLAVPAAHAQATYKRDVPDSLVKKAKVTEAAAVAKAQAAVPKGSIDALELEHENGKLLWSFDFKVPGKTGIDEVQVNAVTGKVGKVVHESPAAEKKEAAADAKAAAKAKPKKP
ncbi:MAG: PepSY domain protein [Gemmatimonadetes bacterium]|nr:PepSY domain protein [Gemmatimonadota bacterium]